VRRTNAFVGLVAVFAFAATVGLNAFACACQAAPADARAAPGPDTRGRSPAVAPPRAIRLSPTGGGIGFDDLGFSRQLRKVLVPAGGSGRVDLVDPDSLAVTVAVGGTSRAYAGGHGDGITSADSDGTRLLATDRTSRRVLVLDPTTGAVLTSAALAGHPDYVRWVGGTRELWVTEPAEERIEIFSLEPGNVLRASGQIRVPGGPESLIVDEPSKRAFTHLWKGVTLAIDVGKRSILSKWPNGCRGSRGIALDDRDGLVLAACAEGKLVALDVNHDGRQAGSVVTGPGVDVIAYNATLRHAYVPAADSADLTVVAVSPAGALQRLQVVPTAKGAHCVAADDRAHAWVCDPAHGQLLLVTDSLP
jgi:DNA-binding beta-propeller fold protein YncE